MLGAKRLNSRIQFSRVEALQLGQSKGYSSVMSHVRDDNEMFLFGSALLKMGEESNDLNRLTKT
jgi:hypothetical protein